jgi:organic hydroperoxide reductase OsmC/OhrA
LTTISISEFETRLQWRGGHKAVLSGDATSPIAVGDREVELAATWHPEALLVAAVEGRTLLAFLEQARSAGIEVLFYQSSAMARRVDGPQGQCHYTDLIVRPHVAVRTLEQAEAVRRIFQQLPESCFPSSMLRLTPRIEPVVDAWEELPSRASPEAPTAKP